MASSYTPLGIEKMATGENAGTWGTKTNANLDLIEQVLGGFKSLSIAGGADTTALTVADGALTGTGQARMIEFTGTITGNQVVTIPNDVETFYFLRNSTSGAYTVQFKYATGSGDTFTFATTDKGTAILFATANDGTNPDIYTLPAGDVTLTGTQTLTNKTLTDPVISDILSVSNGDVNLAPNGTGHATVKGNTNPGTIQLNCESNSHGQQIKSQPHSASVTNVMLLPAGADSTLVSLVSTDTLTNKTLTSPKINDTTAITATGTEINYSDLATLGTSAASKVLTANANNLTTISGAILNTEDTLTDQATIVWDVIASPVAKVTLGANRTMAAPSGTGAAAGQFISLLAIQDGTGSRTITWNAVYEFPSDTAPTLTTTANLGDIFSFRYNGSKWLLIGQTLALTLS